MQLNLKRVHEVVPEEILKMKAGDFFLKYGGVFDEAIFETYLEKNREKLDHDLQTLKQYEKRYSSPSKKKEKRKIKRKQKNY